MKKIEKQIKLIEGFIGDLFKFLRVSYETYVGSMINIKDHMELEYKLTIDSYPIYKNFFSPKYKRNVAKYKRNNAIYNKNAIYINDGAILKYQYAICDLEVNKQGEKKNVLIKFMDQTQSCEKKDYKEEFAIVELNDQLKFLKSYIVYFNPKYDDSDRFKVLALFRTSSNRYRYEMDEKKENIILQGDKFPVIFPLKFEDFDLPTIIDLAKNCFTAHVENDSEYANVKDWHFFVYVAIILAQEARLVLMDYDLFEKNEAEIISNVQFQDAKEMFDHAVIKKYKNNSVPQKEAGFIKKYRKGLVNRSNSLKKYRSTDPLKKVTIALATTLWNQNASITPDSILPKVQGAVIAFARSNKIKLSENRRNHTILDWIRLAVQDEITKQYQHKSFEVFKYK